MISGGEFRLPFIMSLLGRPAGGDSHNIWIRFWGAGHGYINNWDPQNHQGHFRFGGNVVNGGTQIGSWPDYDEGWYRIAAEVNLRTGQADFSWHDLDTPSTSGGSSYTYDPAFDFRPDSVQIRLEHWDAQGFNGLDNLFVEVIPEPATSMLLSIGVLGLGAVSRRRRS